MLNIKNPKKSNRYIPTESIEILLKNVDDANKILQKNPHDIEALRLKAINLQKLSFLDPKYWDICLECWNVFLKLNPSDKAALKNKGILLLARNHTADLALECFKKLLEIDPMDPEAWWGKGTALQKSGKPYLAIPDLDKSLEIDSNDALTWMQKGFALSARRETWDQAIECFDKALEINSDDYRVWRAKASVLHKKENLDASITNYDKALELNPSDRKSLTFKGFALTGLKNYDEAIKSFEQALSMKSDDVESLRGMGDALYFCGKYEEAIKTFNKIIIINPKYSDALRQIGFCLLNLGKKSEALNYFERTLKIEPHDLIAQKEKSQLINTDIYILNKKLNEEINEKDCALIIKNISKSFKIQHEKIDTVFSHIQNVFQRKNYEIIQVLDNISFYLKKGEMLGIIGVNGVGKTTLLRILAGIIPPDAGKVEVNGTIIPLLQLGIGFQGELTARENVKLSGMLLGISKNDIKKKVEQIIRFAELEKFADTKLKNFSSGMHARLAFSTAIQVDPDILLVDEILSVGDINFVKKSYREFLSFRERGKSIIFVSHALDHIRNLCDRAMILESGMIKIIGKTDQVVDYYIQLNNKDK